MKKILLAASAACLLAGCATGGGQKAAEPVAVVEPKNFAGQNTLYVGDFRVTFVTFDKSSAKAESPMFSSDRGYARSTLRATLNGVSDEMMQAITDEAYRDFVSRLAQNGYTLGPDSTLQQNRQWSKINFEDSPLKNTSSFKLVTGGNREDASFAPTGRQLVEMNRGGTMPYNAYYAAKEMDDPIINVNYVVHFVYFGSETDYQSNDFYDYKGAEYSAEVSAGQGIQVVPGSGIELMRGVDGTFSKPNGRITINAPVVITGPFGKMADSTSGFQKAANTFSSIMGMGSGKASSAKDITVNATPAIYRERALAVLKEANTRLLGAMVAARGG